MTTARASLPENLELFRFGGRTFDYARDGERLGQQLRITLATLLADPLRWWTLRALSAAVDAPEASVSARLRDCRKLGYPVPRRRKDGGGTWEYRLEEEKTCG